MNKTCFVINIETAWITNSLTNFFFLEHEFWIRELITNYYDDPLPAAYILYSLVAEEVLHPCASLVSKFCIQIHGSVGVNAHGCHAYLLWLGAINFKCKSWDLGFRQLRLSCSMCVNVSLIATTMQIGDFGMSRDLEQSNYYITHGGKIPVKWTSPEVLH